MSPHPSAPGQSTPSKNLRPPNSSAPPTRSPANNTCVTEHPRQPGAPRPDEHGSASQRSATRRADPPPPARRHNADTRSPRQPAGNSTRTRIASPLQSPSVTRCTPARHPASPFRHRLQRGGRAPSVLVTLTVHTTRSKPRHHRRPPTVANFSDGTQPRGSFIPERRSLRHEDASGKFPASRER